MRGIVLDFDGVIVRSMEQHAEAYRRTLRPFGVDVTDAMVFEREGGRSESLIRDFLRLGGHGADATTVARLGHEKQATFRRLGEPSLYPGADAMVRHVRRAAQRLGLVTGTRRENVDRLIPQLAPVFDAILAQDAYTHDKPDPEPYAKAAAALGAPVASCAALENAVKGVQSARAAGYGRVVGITTTMPLRALKEAGADEVVARHDEAAAALAAWARQP